MARDNYVKVQLRLRSHPAVIERDHSVDHVFTLALRIAREQDSDGSFPAVCFTNKYLRRYFDIPDDLPDSYLDRGRQGCLDGGILRAEDDRLVIPGWRDEYRQGQSQAERSKTYRDRKTDRDRKKTGSDDDHNGGPPSGNGNEPSGGGDASRSSRSSRDASRLAPEERRGEEKRRDQRSTVADQAQAQDLVSLSPGSKPEATGGGSAGKTSDRLAEKRAERHAEALSLLAFWADTMDKAGMARKASTAAGKGRVALIEARLREGYTPDQIRAAIRGCKASPHHSGDNDRGTVYDDLKLICRADKLDAFIALAAKPPGAGARASPSPPVKQADINAGWARRLAEREAAKGAAG